MSEAAAKPSRQTVRTAPRPKITEERTALDAGLAGVGTHSNSDHAEQNREPLPDNEMETLTRVSRFDLTQERFALPAHRKKPGWDYQFMVLSVLGQPVDGSEHSIAFQQGWRPAKAKDFPELCPPGYQKETVEQFGQMLMTRPMHLTLEARNEDHAAAKQQEADRMRSAADGRATGSGLGDVRGIRTHALGIEIHGEAGTYNK